MKSPKVSIIVVNYNGGEKIIDCISCINNLDYPNYETIIVDNGSNDGSEKKIMNYKNFKIINNKENLGLSRAMNMGIKKSEGDFILMVDLDAVFEKNLLKKMMEIMLSDRKIGALFPKIYFFYGDNIFNNCGFSINQITGKSNVRGFNQKDTGQFEKQADVNYAPGTVLLVKKELLEKTKGMDEDYFVYYADADLCSKIRKLNYRIVYTPVVKAWHNSNMEENQINKPITNFVKGK